MFWLLVVLAVAVIFGLSWVAGSFINKRSAANKGGPDARRRQEQITAANLSGAFPIRKEDQN
jgi:hypothetical protein